MPLTKTFKINEEGSDYIVGDLHGCFDKLNKALYEIGFDKDVDRLFSVGDLVDRGPKNLECLRLITEGWFHAVQGNHEDMMLKALLDHVNMDHWIMNGGDWFMRISQDEANVVRELCKTIRETMPYSMTVETPKGLVGICHAQPPSEDWADAADPSNRDIQTMLWARTWIKIKDTDPVKNINLTYHGHTPISDPLILGSTCFIDTGAVFGGELTIVQIN